MGRSPVPPAGPRRGGPAGGAGHSDAPPLFHRVMDASLTEVRQALIDLRARFNGRVDSDALGRLELVLAEILNNIALHGAGTGESAAAARQGSVTVHLSVTSHGGGLACAVIDDGTPLPAECLVPADRMPAPEIAAMNAGGFGWYIIRDLTQSLFYFREDTLNVLCFHIPGPSAGRGGQVRAGVG